MGASVNVGGEALGEESGKMFQTINYLAGLYLRKCPILGGPWPTASYATGIYYMFVSLVWDNNISYLRSHEEQEVSISTSAEKHECTGLATMLAQRLTFLIWRLKHTVFIIPFIRKYSIINACLKLIVMQNCLHWSEFHSASRRSLTPFYYT